MIINLKDIKILWYGGIKEGRKKKFESVINELKLQTQFISPYISSSTRIGCGKSHVKALKQSLNYQQPVLILEDDINYTSMYKEKFEIPDNSDAVYLGTCLNGLHPDWKNRSPDNACCSKPKIIEKKENYYRISGMLTTHAILYVTTNYKQDCCNIIENDNGKNHCDVLMASKMHLYNVYACKHPMFYQDCESDNLDAYQKTITPLWNIFK